MWAGIVLGLGFTMANVQHFAAGDADWPSLPWVVAWLLDPMVSIVLLGVLWAEQETGRYRIASRRAVRWTKRFTFAATYAMNTWESWVAGTASGIVLHSVPPLLVLTAAEAGPELRHLLTEAVERSYADAAARVDAATVGAATTNGGTATGVASNGATSDDGATVDLARLVALPGGRRVATQPATRPTATRAATGTGPSGHGGDRRSGAKAAMRRHWDAEVAADRIPSGADLDRAAGRTPGSLGRRYAAEWTAELNGVTASSAATAGAANDGGSLADATTGTTHEEVAP